MVDITIESVIRVRVSAIEENELDEDDDEEDDEPFYRTLTIVTASGRNHRTRSLCGFTLGPRNRRGRGLGLAESVHPLGATDGTSSPGGDHLVARVCDVDVGHGGGVVSPPAADPLGSSGQQ